MSKATKPKHKLCRRLGACIWSMDKCPSVKKAFPPGMHGQNRNKLTSFGVLLLEKQHLKTYYWLGDTQFANCFAQAQNLKGNTADNLMSLLERRLDSVVYRSGLVSTIWQSKQLVSHGNIFVNGKKCDKGGYLLRPGEKVSINPALFAKEIYKTMVNEKSSVVPYLSVDYKSGEASLVSIPQRTDIPLTINPELIVEYFAK
jgi:small subunit ribosomal protein S4